MPPGGKVVFVRFQRFTCGKLAFKIGRNLALSEASTGNLSNEYMAEGNELSLVARASNPTVAGKSLPLTEDTFQRRVIDISTSRRKGRNPAAHIRQPAAFWPVDVE